MSRFHLYSFFFFSIFSYNLSAQSYFQQDVHYLIKVKLDDNKHLIRASEDIFYQNNSQQTLQEIWFHLWPNGYKNNSTAFARQQLAHGSTAFHFSDSTDRGFLDSLSFSVDGVQAEYILNPENPDIAILKLPAPLSPGKSIKISTPFRVKIPSSKFSRLGHSGQQYQICQWYPKPAVYGPKGWESMPYLNIGEFFSDFGSFEVHITVPENYVIAATGELQDNPQEEERIRNNILNTEKYIRSGFPNETPSVSSAKFKTLIYRQDSVHDFAWFADKNYHILRGKLSLENTGREINTYAYFRGQNASEWASSLQYIKNALQYYSSWIGEYPYNVCKVVDGALSAGAGMEYPTITIISNPGRAELLDRVIAHEIGHNWFYGILASNERKNPWMDEGINSFYERRYMKQQYPYLQPFDELNIPLLRKILHINNLSANESDYLTYLFLARKNFDLPANLSSENYSPFQYSAIVYEKTASILKYLSAYLGEEKFDDAMRTYYKKWQFRHPEPEDFLSLMDSTSGNNLSWFHDLLKTRKRLDYSIKKMKIGKDSATITIKNKGDIAGPIHLSSWNNSSPVSQEWHAGFFGKKKFTMPLTPDITRFSVNGQHYLPDFNPKNDEINTKGLFRKTGKPVLRFGTGFENPSISQLYFLPAIGYNKYNGWMGGIALHNMGILRKNLEFLVMPLYGFKNIGRTNYPEEKLAGCVLADYLIRPTKAFFKTLTFSASAERYATGIAPVYQKFTGGFSMLLKNRNPLSGIRKEIIFRHIEISYEPYLSIPGTPSKVRNSFNQLLVSYTDKRKLNPYGAILDIQQGTHFVKTSATIYHFFAYNTEKKGLSIRLFAGTFLDNSAKNIPGKDARFRLSGQNGSQDYLFNDVFLGRNMAKGIWSQQMTETDGGFKINTPLGQTWSRLLAINLKSTIPGRIPIRLFADIGFYDNDEPKNIRDNLNYVLGPYIAFLPNVFEVYFPMLTSTAIKETPDFKSRKFTERIRFMLNLKLANPISIFRNFQL